MAIVPSGNRRLRALGLAACALAAMQPAGAVFVLTPLGNPRSVTLRIGAASNTVHNVTFTVSNAAIHNGTPVAGVPSVGTPATTPAGGVEIEVVTVMPPGIFSSDTMTLSANSTAGLTCIGGSGCGTTIIPFTSIRWTSYNLQTGTGAGQDIQSGAFNGSGNQQLATYTSGTTIFFGNSVTMRNVLVFEYDNATIYPSGRYTGRVIYTATNL